MTNLQTETLAADSDGFADAAQVLAKGGLVAFPTETVYGLGADATNDDAVARIFAAKGRPSFNPLIVHVADLAAAQEIGEFDETAQQLADAFWPGPLTLVLSLRSKHGIAPLVSAGLSTIALRVPAHPVAQGLLDVSGLPIAAPSANPSGRISPTTAAHVAAGLTGKIDAIIDGGACAVGLESTIVGGSPLALLRPGGLSVERIEKLVGPLAQAGGSITAPGQLASHYAPKSSLRLNANCAQPDEAHLGFGPMQSDLNLSLAGDLTEAAANLFGHLHKLDQMGRPIAVAPIPDVKLGRAINDRLRRAAAPR